MADDGSYLVARYDKPVSVLLFNDKVIIISQDGSVTSVKTADTPGTTRTI